MEFRLPNGIETDDAKKYAEAWQEFARPITEITNTVVFGLDPGISLQAKGGGMFVHLPQFFAAAIVKRLTAAEQLAEAGAAALQQFESPPNERDYDAVVVMRWLRDALAAYHAAKGEDDEK